MYLHWRSVNCSNCEKNSNGSEFDNWCVGVEVVDSINLAEPSGDEPGLQSDDLSDFVFLVFEDKFAVDDLAISRATNVIPAFVFYERVEFVSDQFLPLFPTCGMVDCFLERGRFFFVVWIDVSGHFGDVSSCSILVLVELFVTVEIDREVVRVARTLWRLMGDRGIPTFRSFMSCLTYAYRPLVKSEELREICWHGLYAMLQKLSGSMSSSVFPMYRARFVEAYKLSGRTDSIIPNFEKAVERFPLEGQVLWKERGSSSKGKHIAALICRNAFD